MNARNLHTLDTSVLEGLLAKKLFDLQKWLAEKNTKEIDVCNIDIAELQKLIELRKISPT